MNAEEVFKQQIKILKKPPYRRSPDELERLVGTFVHMPFFKNLTPNVRTQVCRGLNLEHHPAGTTIFREGDTGDKFYIILSGSVAVLIKQVLAEDLFREDNDCGESQESDSEEEEEEGDEGTEPKSPRSPKVAKFQSAPHRNAILILAEDAAMEDEDDEALDPDPTPSTSRLRHLGSLKHFTQASLKNLQTTFTQVERDRESAGDMQDWLTNAAAAHRSSRSSIMSSERSSVLSIPDIKVSPKGSAAIPFDPRRSSARSTLGTLEPLPEQDHFLEPLPEQDDEIPVEDRSVHERSSVVSFCGSASTRSRSPRLFSEPLIPGMERSPSQQPRNQSLKRSTLNLKIEVPERSASPQPAFGKSDSLMSICERTPSPGPSRSPSPGFATSDSLQSVCERSPSPAFGRTDSLSSTCERGPSPGPERSPSPAFKRGNSSQSQASKRSFKRGDSSLSLLSVPDRADSTASPRGSRKLRASKTVGSLGDTGEDTPRITKPPVPRQKRKTVAPAPPVEQAVEEREHGTVEMAAGSSGLKILAKQLLPHAPPEFHLAREGDPQQDGTGEGDSKHSDEEDSDPEDGEAEDEEYDPVAEVRQLNRLAEITGNDGNRAPSPAPKSDQEGSSRKDSRARKESEVDLTPKVARGAVSHGASFSLSPSIGANQLQVATLRQGGTFGDVALQTDAPRTATVKTAEISYFATLTRDDYKAILQSTFEKAHEERQMFLCQLPLFASFQPVAFNKIVAMLQFKTLQKNEVVYDWDMPIMEIYFAKEGEFAVSFRVREIDKTPDRAHKGEPKNDFTSERPVVPHAKTKALGAVSKPETLARIKLEAITVSIVSPPCVFGLTSYILGDRKYHSRVSCQSMVGVVYSIQAKEIVQHLPKGHRERIHAAAEAEDAWCRNRLQVLQHLHAPLDRRCGNQHGRRWFHQDTTVHERLQLARGDTQPELSAYSFEGRLRAIGKAFLATNCKPSGVMSALSMPDQHPESHHVLHKESPRKRTEWLMEKMVASHPEALHPRCAHMLHAEVPEESDHVHSSIVPIYAPPVTMDYKVVSKASWNDERLAVALDGGCFHTPTLDHQVRGRADGSKPTTEQRNPIWVGDNRSSNAIRRVIRSPATSTLSDIGKAPSSPQASAQASTVVLPGAELSQTEGCSAQTSTTSLPQVRMLQHDKGSKASLDSCMTAASEQDADTSLITGHTSASSLALLSPSPGSSLVSPTPGNRAHKKMVTMEMLESGQQWFQRSPSPQDMISYAATDVAIRLPYLPNAGYPSNAITNPPTGMHRLSGTNFFAEHLAAATMWLESPLAPQSPQSSDCGTLVMAASAQKSTRENDQVDASRFQNSVGLNLIYSPSAHTCKMPTQPRLVRHFQRSAGSYL